MPLLFKNPENVIRRIETINPNINPNNDRDYTATLQPSVNEIPLVFGKALVTPVPIFKIDGPEEYLGSDGEATKSKMIFYALSANTHDGDIFSAGDYIENVYIDGTLVTGAFSISPSTGDRGVTVDWKLGKYSATNGALGACLNAGGPSSNFGGNTGRFRQNVYFGFVKAGSDFTEHAFYNAFGGGVGQPYPNLLSGGFPDNSDFDMLVVFYKFNKQYFSNENPDLQVTYQRYPRMKTGAGSNPDSRYTPTVGNCILEILDNAEWGMGLGDDDYEYNDFKNIGPLMAGVFSISNKPLIEILRTIDAERTDRQMFEQEGRLRYAATNDSGLTITDDNIIEEIEVQYPDSTVAPTKLIATYESHVGGSTEIEIGTDNTNVVSTNLYTATDLASAQTLATQIWNQFNNTITVVFKADKSMHQFGLRDLVDVSTEVFSATDCIIVDMVQNPDYTYNMTLEADAGTAAPTPNLRNKTPVIQIGDGLYRPPDQEPTPNPGGPDPLPPIPAPIIDSTFKIISGLEHPYNFNTGSVNTAWYLGGTTDGTTKDARYDANGLRTRFLRNQGGGATYVTDYSLIWRDTANPAPTAIIYAADNGMTAAEQATSPVGVGLWQSGRMKFRLRYTGFFNDEAQSIKFNDGTSWQTSPTTWPQIFSENPTYPGQDDNQLDYVFQVGEIGYGNPYNYRYVHTLDTDTSYRPSSSRFFMIDAAMKRSSVYRLHFTAIFGDPSSPDRVEYIGSTSMWGDERSIQDADEAEAIATGAYFGKVYTPNYTAPPDRDLT